MAYEVWPDLDPNEILDFGFDWVDRLDSGDTIDTSTWEIVDGDCTEAPGHPSSNTDTIAKIWLTGGTLGETCIVTNHVTTTAGRQRDRSAKLKIKAK